MKIGSTQIAKSYRKQPIPILATYTGGQTFKLESPVKAKINNINYSDLQLSHDEKYLDDEFYIWDLQSYRHEEYRKRGWMNVHGIIKQLSDVNEWVSKFKRPNTIIRKINEIQDYREGYSYGARVNHVNDDKINLYRSNFMHLRDKYIKAIGKDLKEGDQFVCDPHIVTNTSYYHSPDIPIRALEFKYDYSIIKDKVWIDTNLKEELLKGMPSIINMQELPKHQMSSIG